MRALRLKIIPRASGLADTMRYAIFSDIHGNRQAWEAVLADMEALQVEVMVCLGDVVGYGPCPQEVLRGIRARTGNIVMGNHDAAAAGLMDLSIMNPNARHSIEWTTRNLDAEALRYLSGLPMAIESGPLLFVHAEALQPGRFSYIDEAGIAEANFTVSNHEVIFVGHTHMPTMFRRDERGRVQQLADHDCMLNPGQRYIVNVGSVGEPRSFDDLRARYVIYDSEKRELYFRRIPFDPEAYRADLLATELEITPWFLTVLDHQRSVDPEAARALIHGVDTSLEPAGGGHWTIQELIAPARGNGHPGGGNMPVPRPTPARRRRRSTIAVCLALFPILAFAIAVVVLVERRLRGEPSAPAPSTRTSLQPAADQSIAEFVGPPREASALSIYDLVGPPRDAWSGGDDPVASPEPEPPAVALVPEPAPVPPEPATAPAPDPGPPPIPPEPANPAAANRLHEGLIFYAPLDEEASELTASDMSSGKRHLDATNALPGEFGRVGLACRLRKQGGLISEAKPLPQPTALTISFWLRHPDPPPPDEPPDDDPAANPPPAPTPVEAGPPVNLVSFKDYCDVRLENHQVVANLDRKDAEARLDLPQDRRWHHVLVQNSGGITSIWIDHRSHSDPVNETLLPVPAENVAVQVGGETADFYIDEIAIWNRVFTDEERQVLYRRGRLDTPILTPTRTIAYWGFDEESGSRLFEDAVGNHALGAYKSWRAVNAIAPESIPATLKTNSSAAQLWHVAEDPDRAGSFQMKPDRPFTYEGWVRLGAHSSGILGGTIPGANDKQLPGWRLAVRSDKAMGSLAFIYDSGAHTVQALATNLPLYDGLPHHFAAVWNPISSPTQGAMELYLDKAKVATVPLATADLGPPSDVPFHILASGAPFVLDELRFTSGALGPDTFLTGGLPVVADPADAPAAQPRREESVMDRRNREALERRAREAEARQRVKEEQKAAAEKRKREEEEKRKRNTLGLDRKGGGLN